MAALGKSGVDGGIPLWLKILWTLWVFVWAPVYWRYYGAQNFLFFCDLGIFFVGIGLWTESSLIFSWQAVSLLIFQTLFDLDLLLRLLSGHRAFGGSEFMFDGSLPLYVRLLSLFHVVMPPLLLWAIWRLGYDKRALWYQTVTTWIVAPINYFWRPAQDVNWARGLFFHEQHLVPGFVYLIGYIVLVPLLVYLPTHWILRSWQDHRNCSQGSF